MGANDSSLKVSSDPDLDDACNDCAIECGNCFVHMVGQDRKNDYPASPQRSAGCVCRGVPSLRRGLPQDGQLICKSPPEQAQCEIARRPFLSSAKLSNNCACNNALNDLGFQCSLESLDNAINALGEKIGSSKKASLIPFVSGTSLVFLALLGGLAVYVGGARVMVGVMRVMFWGALAMGLTAGIGMMLSTVA
ncbi:MAG: hypothetical protein M3A44_12725 [Gammaproteobacteria bacterium]